MLKTVSTYFIILGSLMHIFCCGLPLLLSFTTIAAVFGISSLSIFEIEWFEAIESYLLIIMGIMLALTYIINRFSTKLDCLESGFCAHPPCGEKKDISSYLLRFAIVLYFVNIVIFVLDRLFA